MLYRWKAMMVSAIGKFSCVHIWCGGKGRGGGCLEI